MIRIRASVAAALAASAIVLFALASPDAQVGRRQVLLDANVAAEKELLELPHLSPALVRGLLERRPFLSVGDLDSFLRETLSREQIGEVYDRMFVAINLNTAPDRDIRLIPGVGTRMLHEFLEYRPYEALDEFQREIGKYVDDEELARLEQYVFVPIDLNAASDDDILSIPGVGPRTLDEIKKHRPYSSMEQFRREIGRSVEAGEVARLERYVTLD
jgi:DNA uptake protein ComE-like DNA-binding protein